MGRAVDALQGAHYIQDALISLGCATGKPLLQELNTRSREVLRRLVDEFVTTGQPVGSRTLSRRLSTPISPATVRNVMADLEESGLLYAPHTSAGRLPTELGLRVYVDGLLELGNLTEEERASIEGPCHAAGRTVEEMLSEATEALSELSGCAGIVLAPKSDLSFRQVEFVMLGSERALAVMVTESGLVENRVIAVPPGMTQANLTRATNYLNARLAGHTLEEVQDEIQTELDNHRAEIDQLTQRVVEAGIAEWSSEKKKGDRSLIVRGRTNLLEDITALGDLERIRQLFDALEAKSDFVRLLEGTRDADGVQIFIGAKNELFGATGCSLVVAPYRNNDARFIGAIGVIGPTRINYGRIIPMVDHTAELIGRMLG